MELRHLRYFAALAGTLSFTRAAAQVNVTQSTLSHQIRQLEDELGRRLFDRVGRRVHLTPDGQAFLESVSASLGALDTGLTRLRGTPEALAGAVRVGATIALAEAFVPQCLAAYLQDAPSARLTLEAGAQADIRQGLLDETLDIGLAYPPLDTAGLWSEPLFEERLRVLVRKSHPLAKRRSLRLVDLHGQRMVMGARRYPVSEAIGAALAAAGAVPQVLVEGTGTYATLRMLIASNDFAAIVPESAALADSALRAIPVQGPAPTMVTSIYLKAGRRPSRAARQLIEIFRQAGRGRTRVRRAETEGRSAR